MAQGFVITEKGQKWIAQYAATKPSNIVITRVMVGSGELAEDDNPEQFDNLVQPVAQASSTIPMVKNNIISFIVEYRNDSNGGLKEGFWLREFGVFARDGEQEILLYYATLEAYPQYVDAYQNNKVCVKKYPVNIAVIGGIKDNTKVKLEYSPTAFVTEERMKEFTQSETIPYLQEALKNSDTMIQQALESKADAEIVAAQLAQKANSVDVSAALAEKANSADMTEELNKKANKNDMQIALAEKANAQEVQQALNQKADAETMTTELEKKANEITMLEELAKKANKNDMVVELAKKADKEDMQKELDKKADLAEVEELLGQTMDESSILMELDKKANKTDVQIELDKKADAEAMQEELGKKADTEVVQQELDKKADSETVSAALALKADNETMTTELGKKANSSHNHSASDINSGTLPIARGGTGNTTGNAATATKLQTARTIDGVNFDGSANIVHFGVCNTATNNSTKTVELPGFVLVEGARIAVYFANDGNAGEIGLNVNNTGLHLIVCRKGYIIASKSWESGQIVEFIYYSSQWIMLTTIACRLYTARTIQTNLASTSSASFDGTANVAPGVTGTLPIANGGTGNTTGNATTATKLQTARTLALSGDVTGSAAFDGTANKTIAATLANSGVAAGTYGALDLMTKNNGTVWVSNNVGLHGTSAVSTWTAKQACKVSFRWRVSSEANCDYLNITAAGTQVLANTGTPTEQTGTLTVTLAANQTIVFTYRKDGSVNNGLDRAEISEVKYGAGTADPNTILYESNIESYFTIENGIYGFYPAIPIPSVTVDAKGRVTKGQTIYLSPVHSPRHTNGTPKEGQNTTASGYCSHAEGYNTTASGNYSHAEGRNTAANSSYSHAEGGNTIANSSYSHAEGGSTTASGSYSHAEGGSTTASGSYSHAEGYTTIAKGDYSHVEGSSCYADGRYGDHASGSASIAVSNDTVFFVSSATGTTITIDKYYCKFVNGKSILEKFAANQEILLLDTYYANASFKKRKIVSVDVTNYKIVVDSEIPTSKFSCKLIINPSVKDTSRYYPCYAEGTKCISIGNYSSHAEGYNTTASGDASHAEGQNTTASGHYSHTEGQGTTASNNYSHAEGGSTTASGGYSHAEGYNTTASGNQSHAGGYYTKANANYQTVIGTFNKVSTATTDKFIIGNGTSDTARSNCLRVTDANGVYSNSTYKSSGADYAEYWEWADGNESKQDRIGLFVALEGDKIHIAQADDDIILGIVSACPSILGDTYDDTWKDMYLFDVYGRPILEEVEIPEKTEEVITTNENGEEVKEIIVIEPAHKEIQQKLNPDYDPTKEYIPRSERPEWTAVGMMGKLVAIDDGSCEVGGWCTAGEGGIATKSEQKTKFYVMKRINESHIKVLIL